MDAPETLEAYRIPEKEMPADEGIQGGIIVLRQHETYVLA
jgi:hypothetical protein